jgi:pre-mRNA-processing factor SLU7
MDSRRRERELEEARKAGTIPAELDIDGNEINPHIPQYMSSAPWYLNAAGPGLHHQRNLKEKKAVADVHDYLPRGQKLGPAAVKFRKGACANCGAMTHNEKDCVERPRKKGARFTGKDIKQDEVIVEMAYDYAGTRAMLPCAAN